MSDQVESQRALYQDLVRSAQEVWLLADVLNCVGGSLPLAELV